MTKLQLAFFGVNLLLALSPGPDNIFVLTQSALYGVRAGILVTLGLCTGLAIHTLLIGLGIGVLIQNNVIAFNLLKFVGCCYLLYLAWFSLKSVTKTHLNNNQPKLSNLALYRRGVINNLTNPKVIIFFLALFPQFINPTLGTTTSQLFILGVLAILATFIIFSSIAIISGKLSKWFNRSAKVQIRINQMAAIIFIGLAINLLIHVSH